MLYYITYKIDYTTGMDVYYSPVDSHLQTNAIQFAIDEVAKRGGTLRFKEGTYLTGTLQMRSHVMLHLEKGAVVKGSDSIEDYPVDSGYTEQGTNGEHMSFSRLIFFHTIEHAGISGEGTIDGQGKLIRSKGRSANLIRIQNCKDITIEDVELRDSAAWSTHILYSDHIQLKHVLIVNNLSNKNTDGVDIDSSKDVLVDGCFMYCGDDCVVVKTTRNSGLLQPSEHIKVINNIFFTLKAAQKIGTESFADIRDVLFENNTVLFADRAIGLYNYDGGTFSNIRFLNTEIVKVQKEVEIQTKERNGKGMIKDVIIE